MTSEKEFEFNNNITEIDFERSYIKYSEVFFFHNLDEVTSTKLLSDLDNGSWILWHYKQNGKERNAITIRVNEGFVHHYNFIFDVFNDNFQILDILEYNSEMDPDIPYDEIKSYQNNVCDEYIYENNKKTYIFKKYKTFYDFLLKLNKIYGLVIDKQVVYEND
jgi:hypothetical protein